VLKYLKAAFTNQWNLLALAAGVGVAVVGGSPDVVLPLVVAAETGYLALLATHPKFQKYVDAQHHQVLREANSRRSQATLKHILRSLPRPLLDRYTQLRTRCQELQRIAEDLKEPVHVSTQEPLASMQAESLDRLLWIYLRLLFTYHSLQRFLEKTSPQRIRDDIERLEQRLTGLDHQDTSDHAQKIRRALEDNLATSQDRIRNYDRARANHEFVELEIDRLENKIKSLAEVAVNRQEPDYVSSQVDQVARSMLETEKTMNDLQVFTGLGQLDDQIPMLLEIQEQRSR
jgi:hypothetical protein